MEFTRGRGGTLIVVGAALLLVGLLVLAPAWIDGARSASTSPVTTRDVVTTYAAIAVPGLLVFLAGIAYKVSRG